MEPIFDNPFSKEVADKFYNLFLKCLLDEGKISEKMFQQISIVSEPEPPTIYKQASNELYKMRAKLEHTIATCYNPPSTRLRRNYNEVAEWYFICRLEGWI